MHVPDDDPLWPRHRLSALGPWKNYLISGGFRQRSEPVSRHRGWNALKSVFQTGVILYHNVTAVTGLYTVLKPLDLGYFNSQYETKQYYLEGARESAYLRQVNFYRRSLFEKNLRGHVWTVPGNMRVKFVVRSFNRFNYLSDQPVRCVHTNYTPSFIKVPVV